jgi:hypothetical protein
LLKSIEFLRTSTAASIYPTLSENILTNKEVSHKFESLSNAEDRQVAIDIDESQDTPAGHGFWNRAEVNGTRRVVADLGFAIK